MSVAVTPTNAASQSPPAKEWTWTQTMAAWIVGSVCFVLMTGALADQYCEMQMAKRPIKAACARVINKIADALGWAPYIIPFLDAPDVPNIEHHAIKAGPDGVVTEQDHEFVEN